MIPQISRYMGQSLKEVCLVVLYWRRLVAMYVPEEMRCFLPAPTMEGFTGWWIPNLARHVAHSWYFVGWLAFKPRIVRVGLVVQRGSHGIYLFSARRPHVVVHERYRSQNVEYHSSVTRQVFQHPIRTRELSLWDVASRTKDPSSKLKGWIWWRKAWFWGSWGEKEKEKNSSKAGCIQP